MYTEKDYIDTTAKLKRHVAVAALIALLGVAGISMGISQAMRWLTDLSAVIFSCLTYFYLSMKVFPFVRYRRFLIDMRNGRSRETDAWFVSIEQEPRRSDGILVYDVIVRVGDEEEDERLFLWDDDKPRPDVQAGDPVHIRSYGNYIKELTVVR